MCIAMHHCGQPHGLCSAHSDLTRMHHVSRTDQIRIFLLLRLQHWLPAPSVPAGRQALVLGVISAAVGLSCTEWVSRHWLGASSPWFMPPMGASAVLLFMLPVSPMAQPWAVIGGNVLSALIGVFIHQYFGDVGWCAALAAAMAITAMCALRCLHPPGGAFALMAAQGGGAAHEMGYEFALTQVGLNSMVLVLMALLLNNLAGRRYPHRPSPSPTSPHHTSDPLPSQRVGVQAQDLDAALASFGELLDIERDDLEDIVSRANLQAQRRQWATVRCDDIMSRDVVTVSATCSVEEVWIRLSRHKVKALPVVNEFQQLVGIVSLHDFFLSPTDRALRKIVPGRLVSEIMTTSVVAVFPDQPIADLVSAFSDGGLHHMPVVDAERKVVGMATQSDLVAALFHLPAVATS